jgi:hypothetical protein
MANKLQWVNFPSADGTIGSISVKRADFVDKDVDAVDRMGPVVYFKLKFKKTDANTTATLTIVPDGGNAKYTNTEKGHAPGIYGPSLNDVATVNSKGYAKFEVHLPPAGGDKFRFRAVSQHGTKIDCRTTIETRRKLYYQVIRMTHARAMGAVSGQFENQFWRADKRIYLKLEQYASGATIPNLMNFDDTDPAVMSQVKTGAKAAYDKAKAPFAVAVLIVNKNCIPGTEVMSVPVTVMPGGLPVFVNLTDRNFHHADPAAPWFNSMSFTPAGGSPIAIPAGFVTPVGPTTLEVSSAGLPTGAGQINYSIRVIEIEGMGLSLPTENLVTVACRKADNSAVPARTMAAITVHEVGHKVGMVPGPQGDQEIDKQSSYYHGAGHSGPHCHHGAPLLPSYAVYVTPPPRCTMFGDIRTNTMQFCPKCHRSLRKLDISPSRKPGISTQF